MTPTAMTTHGQLAISVKRASRWHNLNAPISNYTRRTVLLAGPAPSLQPVMAETEWPLGVLAIFIPRISVRPSLFRHRTEFRVGGTYNSPWSVEGGASRSGFCRSMGMFSLVIVGAPSCPRTGSGLTPGAFGWKITLLGSSLARGAVASGGAIWVPEGRGRALADADSPASGAAPTAGAALDAGLSLRERQTGPAPGCRFAKDRPGKRPRPSGAPHTLGALVPWATWQNVLRLARRVLSTRARRPQAP